MVMKGVPFSGSQWAPGGLNGFHTSVHEFKH